MSLPMWAAGKGIILWAKSKNCRKLADELGDNIDRAADEGFAKDSENIQETIVRNFLLPLCSRLMRENPSRLNTIYEAEQHRLMGGIVYEEPKPADKKTGQNFGPKK